MLVELRQVVEVALVEESLGQVVRGHGLGNERGDALLVAFQNLGTAEVATVCQGFALLRSDGFASLLCQRHEPCLVMAEIGDLVGDDQVVRGIPSGLYVEADNGCALAAAGDARASRSVSVYGPSRTFLNWAPIAMDHLIKVESVQGASTRRDPAPSSTVSDSGSRTASTPCSRTRRHSFCSASVTASQASVPRHSSTSSGMAR